MNDIPMRGDRPALPVAFYTKRTRMLLLFIGGLGFVIIGADFYLHPNRYTSRYPSGYIQMLGAICSIFFGACAAKALAAVFRPQHIGSFAQEGMYLYLGKEKLFIAWHEIVSAKAVQSRRHSRSPRFVGIFIKNPETYYSKITPVAARLAQMNEKLVGTPLLINSFLAGIKPEVMCGWIESYCDADKTPH